MTQHVHVNAAEFLFFTAQLLLATYLLRALAVWQSDNAFGQALSFMV
jgi:hypothetical protein